MPSFVSIVGFTSPGYTVHPRISRMISLFISCHIIREIGRFHLNHPITFRVSM